MRTDGRTETDRQDEPNSLFRNFVQSAQKFYVMSARFIYVFVMDLNTTSNYFRTEE